MHEKSGSPLKEESKEELVNILLKIAATHFVSDAPEPVLLANQVPYSHTNNLTQITHLMMRSCEVPT